MLKKYNIRKHVTHEDNKTITEPCLQMMDCISISSEEPEPPKPPKISKIVAKTNIIKPLTHKQKRNLKIKVESTSKIVNYFAPLNKNTTINGIDNNKTAAADDVFYYRKKIPGSKNKETALHACPGYKIIAGTTFGVDSFRFGIIENITHYFLTHFHADHYIGLTKKFNKPIYMSEITARLVKQIIKVEEQYVHPIKLNEPFIINDVEITAIDANHCPGAVMIIFKLPNGQIILHTGDFRASPDMESQPIFWNHDIDIVYLDTTYFSSRYAFMSQWDSIRKALNYVKQYGTKYNWQNFLIVCGSYLIGKEKVWMNIAEEYKLKVWMDKNRRTVVNCFDDKKPASYLVDKEADAGIHVLPINKCHYAWLLDYLTQFDNFEHILAIIPSGWQKNNAKPIVRGHITLLGIEYSEHSSYEELKRFIRFTRPKNVISTVPLSGNDLTKTPEIPKSWYTYDLKERKLGYQKTITQFLKVPSLPPKIYKENIPQPSGSKENFNATNNNNNHAPDDDSDEVIIEESNTEIIVISEQDDDDYDYTGDTDWMS